VLRVHFLNVGHGDCTVIHHPSGRLTMIDVNNSQAYDDETEKMLVEQELRKSQSVRAGSGVLASSIPNLTPSIFEYCRAKAKVDEAAKMELTDPVEFMQKAYPGQQLWRFVLTHPDLDHMRGLRRVHEKIGFNNFWDTHNEKTVTSFRSKDDESDWQYYQWLRTKGVRKAYWRGESHFAFAKDENGILGGDNIEILSPTREIVGACNTNGAFNDISVVMRINHAGRSVLLPGDAGDMAWDNMVNEYGARLKSDFLKASHHGRDTGYHMKAVRHIKPTMTFMSVGQKPATDASSKYRYFSNQVASTRFYGDIELRIHDNGSFEWLVERNPGK